MVVGPGELIQSLARTPGAHSVNVFGREDEAVYSLLPQKADERRVCGTIFVCDKNPKVSIAGCYWHGGGSRADTREKGRSRCRRGGGGLFEGHGICPFRVGLGGSMQ